ncbi:hypothetical protein DM813_18930 [Pseudomonas alkylphenolica]|uniref:Uncharacterized protein n=1 Tax=Pseudomonas alkylphenolica TaxID=237609 RepID=A0A443ZQB5_9PSED|nr:hypothetical protein [Pseudomonas alkylphenolica]RWU21264.1 hypothetical protein DM813_18930 [Pseudomonas alkylphenolica]
MPTENRSINTEQMVSVPKFYPVDAQNAYPEPVGTLDKLEHHDGAVWVHLNGKRSKLVGLQSLAFLIGNLQTIQAEVFGDQPAAQHQGEPVAVLYGDGSVLTKADCGHAFDTCCKVETPLYTHADTGEVERLRVALKFYADRDHFSEDMGSDWDNVSGEPANILWHEDEAWFVEDGSIARAALSTNAEPAPSSDGFSAEQMTAQGADGYRNGIKAAAELAADYPELAQAIRDLPLPQ